MRRICVCFECVWTQQNRAYEIDETLQLQFQILCGCWWGFYFTFFFKLEIYNNGFRFSHIKCLGSERIGEVTRETQELQYFSVCRFSVWRLLKFSMKMTMTFHIDIYFNKTQFCQVSFIYTVNKQTTKFIIFPTATKHRKPQQVQRRLFGASQNFAHQKTNCNC